MKNNNRGGRKNPRAALLSVALSLVALLLVSRYSDLDHPLLTPSPRY